MEDNEITCEEEFILEKIMRLSDPYGCGGGLFSHANEENPKELSYAGKECLKLLRTLTKSKKR